MAYHIVAITIEKVQTFLFEVLQAHIQEHQSNSGTLQEIIQSSNFISRQLYRDIGLEANTEVNVTGSSASQTGVFATEEIEHRLLQCSGMCVFATMLPRSEVERKIDELFTTYYLQFKGQLLLKYVCFEQTLNNDQDKLNAIAESKRRLKQSNCLNDMIARNQELLFQFPSQSSNVQAASIGTTATKQYQFTFADNMNALFSDKEANNANHFRIAIIKADLDGMGSLFQNIKEYATYDKVSRILSEEICLDFLSKKTAELQKDTHDFKLYPLYIAGDDIFFAVPVAHLITGIKLCKGILESINKRIEQLNEKAKQSFPMLSISIGVEFSHNREPIRYYNERVQQQLDAAKAAPELSKEDTQGSDSCMKICMNNFVFYDSELLDDNNKKSIVSKPNWRHFVNDVKRLKAMMQSGFAAHHFLYGLLEKITDPTIKSSKLKYSNAVLYHLLPHCVAGSTKEERENELILLGVLMSQLSVKNFFGSRNGKTAPKGAPDYRKKISLQPQQQARLESYVRLLLVFSDPRFNGSDTNRSDQDNKTNFAKDHKGRLRGTLFNQPTLFLYEQSLVQLLADSDAGINRDQAKELRKLFIQEESYCKPSAGKTQSAKKMASNKDTVKIYRTLKLSSSMLHRIKRLRNNKSISIDKIAEMIEALNYSSTTEIKEKELLNEQEGKAPPSLYFDKEKFKHIVRQSKLWDSDRLDDYLDTLLIFYRLKELSIQYKLLYPNKKGKTGKAHDSSKKNSYNHSKTSKQKGEKK